MIGIGDATKLAFTKLKTRKVRLIVTLVISSLLFSILLTASFVVRGSIKSVEDFSETGFGNRFIVNGQEMNDLTPILSNPDLIAEAQAVQKELQARKKAEAKRLGIDYDPKSDESFIHEKQGPNGQPLLNESVPEVQAIIANHLKGQQSSREKFKALAEKYDAKAVYESIFANQLLMGPISNSSLTYLKDGKESLDQTPKMESGFGMPGGEGVESVTQQWQLINRELMKPFVLPGQHTQLGEDGSVPIIAPYSAAEKLLKLQPLPKTASAEEKLARLKSVRAQAAGQTIELCYRNETSQELVQIAKQNQDELQRNKDNKNYQKPSLIYGLPKEPCGAVVVERDVRTREEKNLMAKQEQFASTFGKAEPVSEIIKLRIVGLNSDFGFSGGVSVVDIFQSVLTSNLGFGWFSPLEVVEQQPTLARAYDPAAPTQSLMPQYFADLPSADHVKQMLETENCVPDFAMQGDNMSTFNPMEQCAKQGKPFMLSAFGSSSVALDSFKSGFNRVLTIGAGIFAVIAALILMGTVGRIIADSRRETAVFRAIGAKRLDIAQIYITYSLMIAVLIILVSSLIGLVLSQFIDSRYSDALTISSLLAFNVTDYSKHFNMIFMHPRDMLFIGAVVVGATLLAASIPLLTNIRRNPIRDMRDEG